MEAATQAAGELVPAARVLHEAVQEEDGRALRGRARHVAPIAVVQPHIVDEDVLIDGEALVHPAFVDDGAEPCSFDAGPPRRYASPLLGDGEGTARLVADRAEHACRCCRVGHGAVPFAPSVVAANCGCQEKPDVL